MEAVERRQKQRRAFWTKQLHQWHWISSALSLVGMLLFAITGITLNNAARIEASPVVTRAEAVLPEPMLMTLEGDHPLSPALRDWLSAELDVRMDFDSLMKAGSMLGSAAVIVMDDSTSMVRALDTIPAKPVIGDT